MKMPLGSILVGNGDGTYLVKLVGDVRLRLGAAVDEYLDRMFREPDFRSVVVDLTGTDGIDSTALGVLARLSVQARNRHGLTPTLVSTRPDITRLLRAMGFDDIFHILQEPLERKCQLGELPATDLSPEDLRGRILAAHRGLMALNENNREQFKDLVATLEAG